MIKIVRSSRLVAASMLLLCCCLSGWAENKVVLDIDPTKEFPRNSEGDFIVLKSGRILFFYTQFYGGKGDHSPAQIVSIHSDDKGLTWSKEPKVVVKNVGEQNVMSVSLLRLKSGRIAFFYLLKHGFHDCRPHVQFSDDEAETWSEPLLTVAAPGYFVLNNDRVIQLESGRLVMPLAFHRQKGASKESYASFDHRAIAMWYLSDDEGKTWREADEWWAHPLASKSGMQEPGVVERTDGSLLSFARTDQSWQYQCISTNRGKNWSAPAPMTLRSPLSPASIERLPGSADLIAIYNDVSKSVAEQARKRTPLVAAISKDGGKSWMNIETLEDNPEGWYCYTAIEFVDDSVLLAYCAGDTKIGGLNRIRIRRVDLDGWRK